MLKRLLAAFALLLCLSAPALATDITVTGIVVTNYRAPGSTATLRVFFSDTFVDSTGKTVVGGVAGSTNFYSSVTCTVAGGVATCPSVVLPSTTDSSRPQARATLVLYNSAGQRVTDLYTNWVIPASLAPTASAQALVAYNQAVPRPLGDAYATREQVAAMLAGQVAVADLASATNAGDAKTSVAPADPGNPVAVGDNDPRVAASSTTNRGTVTTTTAIATAVSTDDPRVYSVETFGTLTAALSAAGATNATLNFYSTLTAAPGTTIPANVTLRRLGRGQLAPSSGTLTILGRVIDAGQGQMFSGTVSFAGNKLVSTFPAEWWGVIAGDGLDDSATLNTISDRLFADGVQGVIKLPAGVLTFSRALQDTGASNAQWVLPKATTNQYTLTIEGADSPVSELGLSAVTAGTILESTLLTGNGALMGVKTTDFFGRSRLNLHLRRLTFQMPPNPTNSGLDATYIMNLQTEHLRFTTGELYNAVTVQPSTLTSAAVKTPTNNVPSNVSMYDTTISGFRVGVEWGELVNVDRLIIVNCVYALHIREAYHAGSGRNVLLLNNTYHVAFEAGAGPGPGPGFATVDLEVDIERTFETAWYTTVSDLTDPGNIARGKLKFLKVIVSNSGETHDILVPAGEAAYLDWYEVGHTKFYRLNGTYLNSWQDKGGGEEFGSYFKREGQVCLHGVISSGTVGTGTPVFTLPVGYRPSGPVYFVTYSNGNTSAYLDVLASGSVRVRAGDNAFVSFEGVCFPAAQP